MSPVTNSIGNQEASKKTPRSQSLQSKAVTLPAATASLPDDGTRQLLLGGAWIMAVGIAAALAMRLVFGGIGPHGPHTNGGWLSLILAMMCLPFATMLLLLGGAKYLRNRRLIRRR